MCENNESIYNNSSLREDVKAIKEDNLRYKDQVKKAKFLSSLTTSMSKFGEEITQKGIEFLESFDG